MYDKRIKQPHSPRVGLLFSYIGNILVGVSIQNAFDWKRPAYRCGGLRFLNKKENKMEKEEPIHDERTPYTVLLYRKSRGLRLSEIGVFVAGLLAMLPFFELRSAPFVIALLLWAATVMAALPALYRALFRPGYTLYPDRLVIRMKGKPEEVPLSRVKMTYDLPYLYQLNGKEKALLVSDGFLESLDVQLKLLQSGMKTNGKK